ncbi:arylesterase [Psychromonas sp.]|nr:arylesterase [Psychromonas sp.]
MKVILSILCSLLLSACGNNEFLTPLNSKQPILAFGDSLTFGYGAKPDESYPAQLSQLLNIEVINAGVSGEKSDAGLKRLESALDEYQPQLLILCHGGNDILKKQSLSTMKQNLASMITMAQEREIQVVLVSVPGASLFLPDITEYSELAKEYNIPVENEIIKHILKQTELRSDAVHPNAQGYRLISESLYQLLADNGALK